MAVLLPLRLRGFVEPLPLTFALSEPTVLLRPRVATGSRNSDTAGGLSAAASASFGNPGRNASVLEKEIPSSAEALDPPCPP